MPPCCMMRSAEKYMCSATASNGIIVPLQLAKFEDAECGDCASNSKPRRRTACLRRNGRRTRSRSGIARWRCRHSDRDKSTRRAVGGASRAGGAGTGKKFPNRSICALPTPNCLPTRSSIARLRVTTQDDLATLASLHAFASRRAGARPPRPASADARGLCASGRKRAGAAAVSSLSGWPRTRLKSCRSA